MIAVPFLCCHSLPLLLTWVNFNPSMDKYLHQYNMWDEITDPFPNFNGTTVEIISTHTLQDMWLLFHAGIIVNPC